MKQSFPSLLARLEMGSYFVNVNRSGRAASIQITGDSVRYYKTKIQCQCGDYRKDAVRGNYIISKDGNGYITEMLPMTRNESRMFIQEVLG